MTALSFPLSQGFSTFHNINVFRCDLAEFSDNLAGNKRPIVLIISVLQQTIAARSYEKNIQPGRNSDELNLSQSFDN